MSIYIHAKSVEDCGNGLFRIETHERELSAAEREVIRNLFPNLYDRMYDVLEQESMLRSIADPEEVKAILKKNEPPTPVKKGKKQYNEYVRPVIDD